jgi:hypothetical protein
MKIAVVTVTYNDGYKLKEWAEHYTEYKDDIYRFIIVDNGSKTSYLEDVKETFKDAVIIELGYNGGSTAAYNAGINKAMEDPLVDSIALLGNDIKIPNNTLKALYTLLYSEERYGMVTPVLLNRTGSIDCYGEHLNRKNMNLVALNMDAKLDELPEVLLTETVPGGCNLAKREFYEKVGLQDENFFMYADEVDMGIRGERAGFKFVTTTKAQAWHMHINPPGQVNRNPMAAYLMGRNHIYLARKLFGRKEVFLTIMHRLKAAAIFYLSCIKHHKNKEEWRYARAFTKGVFAGIRGDMTNNFD